MRYARAFAATVLLTAVVVGAVGHDVAPATAPGPVPRARDAVLAGSQAGFAASSTPLFDDPTVVERSFDAMAATGAQWVRISFPWTSIEPEPGTYRWELTDRAIEAARARGLQVLANPSYTPVWARPPGATSDKFGPVDPRHYASFVAAAAQRYAPLDVHHWEIWNEPNSVVFWKPRPDPTRYVALLNAAHDAIVAVDSAAVVLTGGTAPAGDRLDDMGSDGVTYSPYRWLRLLYERDANASFDAVAVHPYASFPRSPAYSDGNTMQVPAIHKLMTAHGDGAKSLWATEIGYPTGRADGAVSERKQARFLREYVRLWSRFAFAGPMFVYELRDRGRDPEDREDNFGVLRRDFSEKPAYRVLAAALR